MKRGKTIKITVHYPKGKSNFELLDKKIAEFHAEYIIQYVRKLNCPTEQKKKLIDMTAKKITENCSDKQKSSRQK